MIRSRKILDHARGQVCQLALPGICCWDKETTVFAHLNGAAFGKGAGIKAHDFAGFFACDRCHMAYDLHTHGLDDGVMTAAILRAVISTWLILIRDGIIIVPQDIERPFMERKVKPRKPPEQRAKIQSRGFQKRPKP